MTVTDARTPQIPGYTVFRQDRNQKKGKERNRGGGLIIGCKDTIPCHVVEKSYREEGDEITEAMTIEVPLMGNKKIRIVNMYIPPIRNTAEEADRNRESNIGTSKWPCTPDDIIVGDINAHSSIWDDAVKKNPRLWDDRGTLVEDWMMDNEMVTINEGYPTHCNRNSGTESAPDVAIVHANRMDRFEWKTIDDLGSDHKPILITYEVQSKIPPVNDTPKYKWRLKEARWPEFREEVEKNIPAYYHRTKTTQKLEKTLRKIIIAAANKHIGKKKVNNKSRAWMTKDIKEARSQRNKLRETFTRNREECIEASRKVAAMIKEEKARQWKAYVEKIDETTSDTQMWKTIRSLDGRYAPAKKNETLTVNGVSYVSDHDKANQFAKTYKAFSILPTRKEDRAIRRQVRQGQKRKPPEREESEQAIRVEEIKRTLNEMGTEKAAGDDDITYEMLKNLGPKALEMLMHLYNRCWMGDEDLPTMWKTATICPILKDGKDPEETSSYRPISLLSCMGKLLEKILADRLMSVMERRNLLNDNQAGFRQGKCTTDQVLQLTQQAGDRLHSHKGKTRTITTFFDYEKAYNKVWRDGLLWKMQEMNLPWRFVRYVRHFLSGNKTRVDVNGVKSKQFFLNEGLPQGSAISPLLFLIFINDIDVKLDDATRASLFADDTSIWAHEGLQRDTTNQLMQSEITKIAEWADKWKMVINQGKTKALAISTNPADISEQIDLVINNKQIETVKHHKFLGVTVDHGLGFSKHTEETVRKCSKRVNVMKCLAGKEWGQAPESQRRVYEGSYATR